VCLRIHIYICFLFLGYGFSIAQDTKDNIEKKADDFFKEEAFLEATPLYLRLLSLEPRNHNYNYRYGTCLLYNSKEKQSAFKYLSFAVQGENVEDEAFYYLGRAYHLSYQFKLAIENYKKYKSKAGSKAIQRLNVDRQIEMCQNGLTLLSTITEKVVLSKKEMVESDFFRIYDLSDIGGQIIVTEAFQNKQDVRNGHTPVIHFPANTDKIFYSSYGERGEHKDIYIRQRLPDGSWSKEQKVMGNVNTPYDEDFPYMHPNGRFLYFCSQGHNSMGGYDIFRAEFDEASNKYINVENMDFPISSPDDDLLYVVDSLNRLAYFSSKRESEYGKVIVYNIRVERFPIQIAVIKGTFNSTIDPSVKEIAIQVTDKRSGKRIGTFETNRKGEYLITLPKGGEYEFVITVDEKEDEFKYLIEVPLLKEFRPLKQRIEETTKEEDEIVLVYNLFDEDFDDPMGIMAEIIEAQSKMNINKDNYDLDSLDVLRQQKRILADLGLEGFTTIELIQMTDEKVNDIKLRISNSEEQLEKSLLQIEKSKRIKQDALRKADSLMQLAKNENDPEKKAQFVRRSNMSLALANEQNRLTENAQIMANYMSKDIEKMKPVLAKAKDFQSQIQAVDRYDDEAILAVITKNKSYAAEHLKEKTRVDATFELIEEITKKIREAEKLREKQRKLQSDEEQLIAEIETLENDLPNAKKRERDDMERDLRQKQAQLEDLKSEQRYVANQLDESQDYEAQRKSVDAINNIDIAEEQDFIAQNPLSKSDEQAKKQLIELNNESAEINKELGIETDEDPDSVSTSDIKDYIVDTNTPAIKNLNETKTKYNAGLATEDDLITATEKRKEELKQERLRLQQKVDNKTATSSEKSRINAIDKEIKEKENSIISLTTKKSILAKYTDAFETIEDENISPAEKIELLNETIQKIENEKTNLSANDLNFKQKKESYEQIIEELENKKQGIQELIDETFNELSDNKKQTILANTSEQEKQAIINNIDADYQKEITALQEQLSRGEVDPKMVRNRQQNYISQLENEAKILREKISNNENSEENKQRLAVIEEEIEKENAIERDKVETASELTAEIKKAIIEQVDSEYQTEIEELKSALQNGDVSIKEVIETKQLFQEKLNKEIEKAEKKIDKSPDDVKLLESVSLMKEIAEELKSEIAEAQQIREAEITQKAEVLTVDQKNKILDNIARQERIEIEELANESKINPSKKTVLLATKKDYLSLLEEEEKHLKAQVMNGKAGEDDEIQLAIIKQEIYKTIEEIKAFEEELFIDEEKYPDLADSKLEIEADLNDEERLSLQSESKDLFTLKNQLRALDKLEARLIQLKGETTDPGKIQAINLKIEEVKRKKRTAKISIGELEQVQQDVISAAETSSSNATEKERKEIGDRVNVIAQIDEEINELKIIQQEEANERKKEQIEKKVEKLEAKKTKEKIDLLEQTAAINQREIEEKISSIDIYQDNDVNSLGAKKAANNTEELIRQAEKTKNPKEQQRLLAEANREQKKALEEAEEADRSRKFEILIGDLSSDLSLDNIDTKTIKTTEKDLGVEQIQIGVKLREIEDRLKMIDMNLANAKRKETEQLEQIKKEYLVLKTALEARQYANDDLLETIEQDRIKQRSKGVAEDAKTKPVTYQEEVEFAQTEAYRELFNVTNKLSQKQYELKIKEDLIVQNKNKLKTLNAKIINIENPSKEELSEVKNVLQEINQLEEEKRQIKIEIGGLQQDMADKMPLDSEERKIAKNLVSREVDPIKEMPKLPVMTTGLILNDPNRKPYSEENPIPLEAEKPQGLVFRVQVGAFSRPVPNETFNDFSPVTGEEVRPGLIRYVAGYFGGRGDASNARDQIRQLGYSDAFVVAYCDGERIPVYRAEELMASGACVPSIETPVNAIVSAEEAEREGRLTNGDSFEEKLDEFAYNKAPGAAEAETAETKLGLYFTVQVGVYNKPVPATQLKNITPLVTKRLPNGQIRYSSGIFNDVESAQVKRSEAIEVGISDAFIVAYYKGERLTVSQARTLLEEHGDDILELRNPTIVRRSSVESPITQPQKPSPEPYLKDRKLQVQWESYDRYDEYPTQVLNRYNQTNALFFFDWETGKIKSFVYTKDNAPAISEIENELIPSVLYENKRVLDQEAILVENALNTIDTKVEKLIIKVSFEDLNDDLVNYMIKLNASKSIAITDSGLIITIYDEYNGKRVNLNAIKIEFAHYSATEFETKMVKLERND